MWSELSIHEFFTEIQSRSSQEFIIWEQIHVVNVLENGRGVEFDDGTTLAVTGDSEGVVFWKKEADR